MKLDKVNAGDLAYIVRRMREEDKKEIFATKWHDSLELFFQECLVLLPQIQAYGSIAKNDDGVPVAAIGAIPMHPGVCSVWMFATPDFDSVGIPLTKYVRREFIPMLQKDFHRAECRAIESHTVGHRWLEACEGIQEAVLEGYGKDGEDFYLYAWHHAVKRDTSH